MHTPKIKILKNGAYMVTGNIKIYEKIITKAKGKYIWTNGRELPQSEKYLLCRCGKSKNPPFCDFGHKSFAFDGSETASKEPFLERAAIFKGRAGISLLDDGRCAFARFCHRNDSTAWRLIKKAWRSKYKKEAIKAANECPSGRLAIMLADGEVIEQTYEPEIWVIQDPGRNVSGGLFIRGKIQIESEDGELYEKRDRVVLCRCGESKNKPFCDASHVSELYSDSAN